MAIRDLASEEIETVAGAVSFPSGIFTAVFNVPNLSSVTNGAPTPPPIVPPNPVFGSAPGGMVLNQLFTSPGT